jgi:hypothetical protein
LLSVYLQPYFVVKCIFTPYFGFSYISIETDTEYQQKYSLSNLNDENSKLAKKNCSAKFGSFAVIHNKSCDFVKKFYTKDVDENKEPL